MHRLAIEDNEHCLDHCQFCSAHRRLTRFRRHLWRRLANDQGLIQNVEGNTGAENDLDGGFVINWHTALLIPFVMLLSIAVGLMKLRDNEKICKENGNGKIPQAIYDQ